MKFWTQLLSALAYWTQGETKESPALGYDDEVNMRELDEVDSAYHQLLVKYTQLIAENQGAKKKVAQLKETLDITGKAFRDVREELAGKKVDYEALLEHYSQLEYAIHSTTTQSTVALLELSKLFSELLEDYGKVYEHNKKVMNSYTLSRLFNYPIAIRSFLLGDMEVQLDYGFYTVHPDVYKTAGYYELGADVPSSPCDNDDEEGLGYPN